MGYMVAAEKSRQQILKKPLEMAVLDRKKIQARSVTQTRL